MGMPLRLIQATLLLALALAACGAAPSASAERPFTTTDVATFDSPWAMDFLPGSGVRMTNAALVTEKPGRLWLIDVGTGKKTPVAGVPRVVVSSQGGLLDVVASPGFAGDGMIYLTYSQPSQNGGGSLALAPAKLANVATTPRLEGLTVLWRDPAAVEGGRACGEKDLSPARPPPVPS